MPGIPRTLSGKKLEVPVRKILLGTPVAEAADPDALANPEVLSSFVPGAATRAAGVNEREPGEQADEPGAPSHREELRRRGRQA